MKEACVDASVAVKWVLKNETLRSEAFTLLRKAQADSVRFIAPPLFASEVDSVVRKRVFAGIMGAGEAKKAYICLDAAPVQIIDMPGVRRKAREIAEQFRQPYVYDATYAALAQLRNCEFWTADRKFYDAVKSALPYVKFLGEITPD